MSNDYQPCKTVNGKPSYEAEKLWETYHFCKQTLANPNLDSAERKALEFYVEQMRGITPCADEHKFRKPCKGIGGSGDSEIIKPYVVRDHSTNAPKLRHDGSLVTIQCKFQDVVRYLYTIKSQKAESLNFVDGVRALSIIDQMQYQKPDPYAYAYSSFSKGATYSK
ncbi:MAG: hypothetical protein IJW72_01755 [Alphaproteobacteria bacterium]|nr:hypothetical protein [Alphaproteobacteria bacterium]